jgi:homogentisate 1,2-dioxygenase
MFETGLVVRPTAFAMNTRILQHEYYECWQGLKKRFAPGANTESTEHERDGRDG